MRPDTKICIGVRFVGNKDKEDEFYEGEMRECVSQFMKMMLRTTMGTRFDVCVARSKDEAANGIQRRGGRKTQEERPDDFDKWAADFEAQVLAEEAKILAEEGDR